MKKITFLSILSLVFITSAFAEEKAEADKAQTETTTTIPIPFGSETICEADIFYIWKQNPPPLPPQPAGRKDKNQEPVVMPENKTLFQTVGEQGKTEIDIKNKLTGEINLSQKLALEECRSLHQDQGQCLTKKIRPQQELLNKADFATKNALLAATTSDCIKEQGVCLKTEASEIRCYINKTIDLAATPTPAEKAAPAKKK